jgi:transposase InsO family protein
MTIYGTILPHSAILARIADSADKLTTRAKQRLKILDWYNNHNRNQSLTSRHFGIDRKTLRRWIKRYSSSGINALNDKSHRPHNLRRPTTSSLIIAKIIAVRNKYPVWSKYKIKALLSQENIEVSESTVGRVLKRFNLINDRISIKRKRSSKRTKLRFFKGLKISYPGDMLQIDTKYIVTIGGERMYQFTAIDVLTKQRVLRVYRSQSSKNGKHFLDECISSYPYIIKAIQTDNGSEFMGEFDKYLKQLDITHYYTYPRHPKQNSYVENSHGSDEREFYLQGNISSLLDVMQQRMIAWQNTWNNIRPHQALNYLTPNQYYLKYKTSRLPTRDVITLQA